MTHSTGLPRAARVAAALTTAGALLFSACSGGSSSTVKATGQTNAGSTSSSAAPGTAAPGPSTRPVTAGGDFCRLVTKAEAAALLGRDVKDGASSTTETPVGTAGSCVYRPTTLTQLPTIVNIVIPGTKISHDLFISQVKAKAPEGTAQPGVGEDAWLVQAGILGVYDHGKVLTVEISVDGKPASADTLATVAKKALTRW